MSLFFIFKYPYSQEAYFMFNESNALVMLPETAPPDWYA